MGDEVSTSLTCYTHDDTVASEVVMEVTRGIILKTEKCSELPSDIPLCVLTVSSCIFFHLSPCSSFTACISSTLHSPVLRNDGGEDADATQ